jgi:hypothetical protein
MRGRTALAAWAMGALSTALALAAVVLAGRNGESLSELVFNHHAIGIVTAIGLAVLGALIAGRRPGNPIGWLMSVGALFLGVFSFTQQYAPWPSPSPSPASTWRAGWPPGPTCRASPSPSPSSSSCSPTAGRRRPAGVRWSG